MAPLVPMWMVTAMEVPEDVKTVQEPWSWKLILRTNLNPEFAAPPKRTLKCFFLSATSVQMAMFSFSPEHYDRLQEMVLKGSLRHILKGEMWWKLVNQRNEIYHKIYIYISLYHKTYVLLGVQQNLSFLNQPRDYQAELPFCDVPSKELFNSFIKV